MSQEVINDNVELAVEEGAEVAKECCECCKCCAEAADDYKITAGDVAILGFAGVGVGATAYLLYKGGKKLYNYFKKKNEEKRFNELDENWEEDVEEVYDDEIAEEFDKEAEHDVVDAPKAKE
jgi:hypothetical protein